MIEKVIKFPGKIEITCPSCDSTNVSTNWLNEPFVYGANKGDQIELNVNIPVRICNDCNQEFEDDEAEELKHNEVCMYLKRLNPQDIKNIRDIYRLTRKQFAEITLIGEASLARWETGGLIQNAAYDNYLRLLEIKDNFKLLSKGEDDHLISNTINDDRDKSYISVLGTESLVLDNKSTSLDDLPSEVRAVAHQVYLAVVSNGWYSCES